MPFIHTLDTFFAIVSNDEQLFIPFEINNGQRYNIILWIVFLTIFAFANPKIAFRITFITKRKIR
jgi:hypothetical protein